MKRIAVLFLALVFFLTACAAPASTSTVEPGMVTDEPTQAAVVETPAAAETPVAQVTATGTKPSGGGTLFTDLVRSADSFSLKCSPAEIIFGVKSLDPAVTKVMFFYRVVDKSSAAAAGAMVDSREMVGDQQGHFTLIFASVDLREDLRFTNGWFEYQFVGLNKVGSVVGRSDKIVKQVTFTLGCP